MDYSAKVLGQTAVQYLRERTAAPVLIIGADTFDRAILSSVACFNFVAAARLSAALQQLHVKSTRDVFDHVAPASLALPGIGAISLAVLGAAFEAKRLGGLEAWMRHHQPDAPIVTFGSLKVRDAKAHAAERQATRERKRQRRNQAHTIRRARFHSRRSGSPAAHSAGHRR